MDHGQHQTAVNSASFAGQFKHEIETYPVRFFRGWVRAPPKSMFFKPFWHVLEEASLLS